MGEVTVSISPLCGRSGPKGTSRTLLFALYIHPTVNGFLVNSWDTARRDKQLDAFPRNAPAQDGTSLER